MKAKQLFRWYWSLERSGSDVRCPPAEISYYSAAVACRIARRKSDKIEHAMAEDRLSKCHQPRRFKYATL